MLDIRKLEYRIQRGRMIEIYQVLNKLYEPNASQLQSNSRYTRGKYRKLIVRKAGMEVWKRSFTVPAISHRNSLPSNVVENSNPEAFTSHLDLF